MTKKEFLTPELYNKRDSLTQELSRKWELIMNNRSQIINYLKNFEGDTSFSLYAGYYSEDYIVQKLPNNLHALYLIECIIQDDYLFNRRFATKLGVGEYFRNDGLNFIYDTLTKDDRNKIRCSGVFNLKKFDGESKNAWVIYKEWINKTDLTKRNLKSPLSGSGLRWYSSTEIYGRKTNIDSIFFREKNSLTRTFYHLDFKVGNRWN
jgi:hypothetical protein